YGSSASNPKSCSGIPSRRQRLAVVLEVPLVAVALDGLGELLERQLPWVMRSLFLRTLLAHHSDRPHPYMRRKSGRQLRTCFLMSSRVASLPSSTWRTRSGTSPSLAKRSA